MDLLRILLIAPQQTGFDEVDKTIEDMTSIEGLHIYLVRSPATLRTIRQKISEVSRTFRQPFHVVNVLAHGDLRQIVLDDGDYLDDVSLRLVVMESGAELVVLQSCMGVALANAVAKHIRVPAIATITQNPVKRAYEMNVSLMQVLATGATVDRAFVKTAMNDENSILLKPPVVWETNYAAWG